MSFSENTKTKENNKQKRAAYGIAVCVTNKSASQHKPSCVTTNSGRIKSQVLKAVLLFQSDTLIGPQTIQGYRASLNTTPTIKLEEGDSHKYLVFIFQHQSSLSFLSYLTLAAFSSIKI